MRRLIPTLLLLALSPAWAAPVGPQLDHEIDTGIQDDAESPISTCSKASLRNGVQLPEAAGLYKIWFPEKAWGTQDMIDVITVAAEEMAWMMPEADPIVVGDISRKDGGYLEGHKSHRGGMDVDLGLYWGNGRQHQQGFMVITPQQLDAQANWMLIRALLQTGKVERILLDRKLIDAIRRWAVVNGELTSEQADEIFPPRGTPRVWALTGVVHHATNHKHHMHVRLVCDK